MDLIVFLRRRSISISIPAAMALAIGSLAAGCAGGDDMTTGATTGGATATGTTDPSTTGTTDPSTTGTTSPTGTTADETTGTSATTGDDTTGVVPVPPACEDDPPPPCDEMITKCKEDEDRDWVKFTCDNAPDHTNPDQLDMDGDGFGDVADLCQTVPSMINTADSDRDGVGNECDVCRLAPSDYNKQVEGVPFALRVRRVPAQTDADRDGVGDVCDNCVRVPNCHGYGDGPGLTPHVVGMPTDVEAPDCQADADLDLIGDACAGMVLPGAAGPVGFLPDDDFDQDGLKNLHDACPRQPVARRPCKGDGECPDGASCAPEEGICGHADHDGDGVGDLCDTCPWTSNPGQIVEAQAQDDDVDGDFIGAACEQDAACVERSNPRPYAFYDISVGGRCCVTTYNGQPLVDPDGVPLDVADLGPLPPGALELPPGCEEALAQSEDGKAHKMKACHVDAPSDLWRYLCFMPTWDQEFDGVPDRCDLCPFAHDPTNAIYVDENNMEWPDFGKYCNGAYDSSTLDPANMCML